MERQFALTSFTSPSCLILNHLSSPNLMSSLPSYPTITYCCCLQVGETNATFWNICFLFPVQLPSRKKEKENSIYPMLFSRLE